MTRGLAEYLAQALDRSDPAAVEYLERPRPYPGQAGAPQQMTTPPSWARTNRVPVGPPGPLPRLSQIGPLLRPQPQRQAYRPPRQVIGPGGITGEPSAARVNFADVALPSFLPNPVAPPQGGPEEPQSPFRFEPGSNLPPIAQPAGGQDDLDAAFSAALARVRAAQAASQNAPRKPSRAPPRR